MLMQSSKAIIEPVAAVTPTGWLGQFQVAEKLPFAFIFGCILGLSSPGLDQWWLAWIGLVPLLVLLRGARSATEATLTGLAFGLGYYLVSLSWYLGLFPLRWLGLDDWLGIQVAAFIWFVESLHEALLIAAFSFLIYCLPLRAGFLPYFRRPFFPYLLSVPILWVFLHWTVATSEVFLGIPVNQLAYSQAQQLELIQLSRFGGSGLIDFILVLSNTVIAAFVLEISPLARHFDNRVDRLSTKTGASLDLIAAVVLIAMAFWWGSIELKGIASKVQPEIALLENPQTPPVEVALIQGNISIEEDRLKTSTPYEIAERYGRLIKNLGVSIMVLPEGVINSSQLTPGLLLSRLKHISNFERNEIVVGTAESSDHISVSGARIISPFTSTEDLYIKRRLMPFLEFTPSGLFNSSTSNSFTNKLPVTSKTVLASHSIHLLKSAWGKIGVSICLEVIYPHLIAEEVRHGASLLINLSNLGWFHGSFVNKQILAAAVFRAVENGRFMILSTNTGISAIIDPAGMITSASYPNKRGILLNTVQFVYKNTPFSKMWWL